MDGGKNDYKGRYSGHKSLYSPEDKATRGRISRPTLNSTPISSEGENITIKYTPTKEPELLRNVKYTPIKSQVPSLVDSGYDFKKGSHSLLGPTHISPNSIGTIPSTPKINNISTPATMSPLFPQERLNPNSNNVSYSSGINHLHFISNCTTNNTVRESIELK